MSDQRSRSEQTVHNCARESSRGRPHGPHTVQENDSQRTHSEQPPRQRERANPIPERSQSNRSAIKPSSSRDSRSPQASPYAPGTPSDDSRDAPVVRLEKDQTYDAQLPIKNRPGYMNVPSSHTEHPNGRWDTHLYDGEPFPRPPDGWLGNEKFDFSESLREYGEAEEGDDVDPTSEKGWISKEWQKRKKDKDVLSWALTGATSDQAVIPAKDLPYLDRVDARIKAVEESRQIKYIDGELAHISRQPGRQPDRREKQPRSRTSSASVAVDDEPPDAPQLTEVAYTVPGETIRPRNPAAPGAIQPKPPPARQRLDYVEKEALPKSPEKTRRQRN